MIPISYLQTDKRWANNNYSAKGETTTIAKSGCGPTCAAMVIASLKDKTVTPAITAAWALKNGYKACKQGTYYSYFVPQLEKYGITCRKLNNINNYHNKYQAKLRSSIIAHLKAGNWIIACMGKGTWTSSGHYVLAYGLDSSGKVLIRDPYSTASTRICGNQSAWLDEIKYVWLVETAQKKEEQKSEVKKEDKEMVTKTKLIVDGKEIEVNRILKDGTNFVNLRELATILGCKVDYDEEKKMPVIIKAL